MPNLAQTLKQEIARIAKQEANKLVAAQTKTIAELKRRIASLNKRMAEQERLRKANAKVISKVLPDTLSTDLQPQSTKWFTARGVRSIRKRLGLSQVQFSKLVGMSPQAVMKWEARKGKLNLRPQVLESLVAARGMGKQEVAEKLSAIGTDASKPSTPKTASKPKKK